MTVNLFNNAGRTATAALLLMSFAAIPAHAAGGYDVVQAKRYIATSERAWSSGNPDELNVVNRIIADDFIWLLDGKVLRKRDAIAEARHPGGTGTEQFNYVHIRFFGNTAIAQGQQTVTRRGGKIRNLFMDTWLMRSGKWQIVAATDIDLKA